MVHSKEFIGRGSRGQNSIAVITPVAERLEDGAWAPLAEARALFPPQGSVEIRGVAASSMRDGDWFIFSAAQNDRYRASIKFRAVSLRHLSRFLELPEGETPEARRRLVVEIGLENGAPGDWAIRITSAEIVRVMLAQAPDGRWRASHREHLASLPLRHFDPDFVIPVPNEADSLSLYDYEASDQIGRVVNWSTDADYVRAISVALAAGSRREAAQALEALAARSGILGGRVSAAGGVEPAVLDEAIRSGAIAERLRTDAEALDLALSALITEPAVQEAINALAEARVRAEMPALEAAARAKVKAEAQADLTERLEQVRSAVAELEAEELAALERTRAALQDEIEASASEMRAKAAAVVEAEVEQVRQQRQSEIAVIDERIRSATEECATLDARRSLLADSVASLGERERALLSRVEMLARADEGLSRRAAKNHGHPRFVAPPNEARIQLREIEAAAAKLTVLSPRGVEALAYLAILFTAGEVPILRGPAASDFVEITAALLAGGRVAHVCGDPTLVTYDDLWSRAGSNGPTALGSAAAWASEVETWPVLGYISGADHSAARFWFPALTDVKRRGLLPKTLMLCVGLENHTSEEAEALPKDALVIEAEGLFEPQASLVAHRVFAALVSDPISVDLGCVEVDDAAAALVLMKHGSSLTVTAAVRLARLYAAARAAFGDERAEAFTSKAAAALGGSSSTLSPSDNPVIVSLVANA